MAVQLRDRYIPAANASGGRYVSLVPRPTNGDQYVVRADHNFSTSHTINLRYFRDVTELQFQTGDIDNYVTSPQRFVVTNWALQDTKTFRPTLLNEFRIGVQRYDSPTTALGTTQLSDFGANYHGVMIPQLPNIGTTGYFSLGSNDIFRDTGNIYQGGDTMRWFRGRHSLSFGGEFARNEYFGRGSSANQGTFTFDGSITRVAWADFPAGQAGQPGPVEPV